MQRNATATVAPAKTDGPDPTLEVQSLATILLHLKDVLRARTDEDRVSVKTLVETMEKGSFPVLLLLPALLLVSPLSAIPGATSLFGLFIATLLLQYIVGRKQIWLPQFLLAKTFSIPPLLKSLNWLDRPVSKLERLLKPRFRWLFLSPFAQIPVALVLLAALCAPLMEVIPGSGTSVGAAICVFCAGLLARDGVFVVLGASLAAFLPIKLGILIL
jgi:hypothetical protein